MIESIKSIEQEISAIELICPRKQSNVGKNTSSFHFICTYSQMLFCLISFLINLYLISMSGELTARENLRIDNKKDTVVIAKEVFNETLR